MSGRALSRAAFEYIPDGVPVAFKYIPGKVLARVAFNSISSTII